jgi:hypothetical protein
MSYSVGQILYIILSKKGQVYPMCVVEEITKKTLKGEEVNYVLQAGEDLNTKVMLSQIEGEIFESSEDARKALVERATSQIDRIIQNAVQNAKNWHSIESQINEQEIHELPQAKILNDDVDLVTLPDGTVARLKSAIIA